MFQQMFMPLSRHADEGFQAVGDSFKDAAEVLVEAGAEGGVRRLHGHLPINYLYRHAIELYLKSMLLVIHRRLKLNHPDGTYDPVPQIQVGKASKSIYSVHDLKVLFEENKRLANLHRPEMAKIGKTDWSATPVELENAIKVINDTDPVSTAFRYPVSKDSFVDAKKSSFKPMDLEAMQEKMAADSGKRGKVMMLMKDDDNIVEGFALDDTARFL
jgi:hypothetical protein